MNEDVVVHFRKAVKRDVDFLSQILVSAAAASGVEVQMAELSTHLDTYQYVEGFPNKTDIGIVAETNDGILVGAAWVRLLPTDAHAVNEPLPELTMGVVPEYQRMGIGKRLLEELYREALAAGLYKISLGVHKHNIAAVNLYKQQSWIEDGCFEEYIMMSKIVN